MYPFKATQYDTFMALVQAANPGLDIAPLTSDQLRALVPTTVSTGGIQDTQVRLMVRPGNSKYYGTQTVTYRRINLTNYLRGLSVTLDDYLTGSGNMTGAQFAVAMNNKYGTNFSTDGSEWPTFSAASGTQYTVSPASSSLCYEGNITFTWTRGKQYISAAISNPVLTGRLYPGGNTMPPNKPVGDFFTYNLDCSSIKSALTSLTSGATITPANWGTGNSIYATILAFLQNKRPDLNFNSSDSATNGGLGNLVATRYTLPSASVNGANSSKYASVVTIQSVSGSWFKGMLYLHYT
jgi:hypothetical protein